MDYNQIFDKCDIAINEWAISQMQQKSVKFSRNSDNSPYCQYLNYLSKLISTKPRAVSQSSKFNIDDAYIDGFNNLKSDIVQGKDINPYLSKLINVAKKSDGMLDHFGCKHFHLGNELENNGVFVERTGPLAIGFVTNDEIFFIDVKTHTKDQDDTLWYEQDVIEIIHQERPDLIERFKVTGFKDISPKFDTPEQIKAMRDINVNTHIVIDNTTAYAPMNLGNTLGGLGIQLTMNYINTKKAMAQAIYSFLNDFKNNVKNVTINNIEVYDLHANNSEFFNHFKVDMDYQIGADDKKHTQPFDR